nr:hypothetical protein CFP56_42263 [Quercus suber]
MAQRPSVVFIARHGPRLDAANQSWHLSTPTPYDPPLTYAGWKQSQALGIRIAALLDAKEKASVTQDVPHAPSDRSPLADEVTANDSTPDDASRSKRKASSGLDEGAKKVKKRKYKVVIHTSPFLRCVQTGVAIAAGIAQYQPQGSDATGTKPVPAPRPKTPATLHSASPRLRAMEGGLGSGLPSIPEPKANRLLNANKKALPQQVSKRKVKIRVDAFLGEWLNPQYFDQITPPPPSAMMVATAKAELMSTEQVDTYTPNITYAPSRTSGSSLWGGAKHTRDSSKDSVDDLSSLEDALPPSAVPISPRRDRTSSFSNVGTGEAYAGRLSGFRHLTHSPPTFVKPTSTAYEPPTPHYAVSGSDTIPRGYVTHARQACLNVDNHWDSSRPPQSWGDGGDYGEEWSAMHKRFRRGLNHLIQWYSQHNADDRAEDALGLDQAERHEQEDEEDEELVMVLVTHGAGCNALIGALTAQPVLLDVGMASLTMAVHKENAPPMTSVQAQLEMINGHGRRNTIDMGLSAVYEMKLVSSSDHLRPGVDPAQPATPAPTEVRRSSHVRDTTPKLRLASDTPTDSGSEGDWNYHNQVGRGSNSSLGSMLRPSLATMALPASTGQIAARKDSSLPSPPFTPGLWTPPAARTPLPQAEKRGADSMFRLPSEGTSVSPPQSRPLTSNGSMSDGRSDKNRDNVNENGNAGAVSPTQSTLTNEPNEKPRSLADALTTRLSNSVNSTSRLQPDRKSSIEGEFENVPTSLSRGLSQKGLWGSGPRGAKVERKFLAEPKRRWSVTQPDEASGQHALPCLAAREGDCSIEAGSMSRSRDQQNISRAFGRQGESSAHGSLSEKYALRNKARIGIRSLKGNGKIRGDKDREIMSPTPSFIKRYTTRPSLSSMAWAPDSPQRSSPTPSRQGMRGKSMLQSITPADRRLPSHSPSGSPSADVTLDWPEQFVIPSSSAGPESESADMTLEVSNNGLLNDLCIEVMLSALNPSHPQILITSTFFVDLEHPVQRGDVVGFETPLTHTIIIPLHWRSAMHWSLCVVRVQSGTVELYDPIPSNQRRQSAWSAVKLTLQGAIPSIVDWLLQPPSTYPQLQQPSSNQHDCGVYAIIYAVYTMHDAESLTQITISTSCWRLLMQHMFDAPAKMPLPSFVPIISLPDARPLLQLKDAHDIIEHHRDVVRDLHGFLSSVMPRVSQLRDESRQMTNEIQRLNTALDMYSTFGPPQAWEQIQDHPRSGACASGPRNHLPRNIKTNHESALSHFVRSKAV